MAQANRTGFEKRPMSGKIRVLDEKVINRIAAGEVVERPASLVKELVENAIDAEATSIRIDIENGGKKLVRVRDNGTGMSRDDAFLALERHATSKLRTETDLHGIATLGFRGEALASIASVSTLRMVTADDSGSPGTDMVIEGGALRKCEELGAGKGTLIEVRNLFFNVPVRRKFLKSPAIEAATVQELLTKMALAFPAVGFTYSEDNRVKIDAPPVRSTFERIHSLFSKDVRDNLVELNYTLEETRLHGYVARPPYARSTMRSIFTFVNRRSVRDRLINGAVTRAFADLMERGRFPLAILFVELPPEEVDVNVHPQKAEVRFPRPKIIADLIVDGIHQALMGAPFNPPPGPRESLFPRSPVDSLSRHLQDERFPDRQQTPPDGNRLRSGPPATEPRATAPSEHASLPEQIQAASDTPRQTELFSSLHVLGRLPGSFLVLYNDRELIVMDHHAAHERVLFDRLMAGQREGRRFSSQSLIIPHVLEYPPLEALALAAHLDLLTHAGFRIEEFGENDFVVKGVPEWLGTADLGDLFADLIDGLLNTGIRGDPAALRHELLKRMACKAAMKEPDPVQPQETRALLDELDRTGAAHVCPHGRPFVVTFPLDEIRKRMGRK
jgi:DNA mismatch repair protein MutL